MKKFIKLKFFTFFAGIWLLLLNSFIIPLAHAQNQISYSFPFSINEDAESITIKFSNLNPNLKYKIWIEGYSLVYQNSLYPDYQSEFLNIQETPETSPTVYFVEKTIYRRDVPGIFSKDILNNSSLRHKVTLIYENTKFETPGYIVLPIQAPPVSACEDFMVTPNAFDISQIDTAEVKAVNLDPDTIYGIYVSDYNGNRIKTANPFRPGREKGKAIKISYFLNRSSPQGIYEAFLYKYNEAEGRSETLCKSSFALYFYIPPGTTPIPLTPSPPSEPAPKKLCPDEEGDCAQCFNDGKTWTALGCIPTNDLNEFAGWLIGKVIFIASGIAFLLMAFGAFQIITSSGDPKKAQAGKETLTSALTGLLFIILSIFLLKLIGVDILRIPGFGS